MIIIIILTKKPTATRLMDLVCVGDEGIHSLPPMTNR